MAWKDFNRKGVGRIINAGGNRSSMAAATFEAQLKEFSDVLLPEYQTVFVKKISMELLKKLINKSPVDTGRFRGAWVVGRNTPDRSEPDNPDPTGIATEIKGISDIGAIREGDIVYISNNLDYALMLEYGWSKQAPQGMAAISLNEIEAWLQGVKKTAIESL